MVFDLDSNYSRRAGRHPASTAHSDATRRRSHFARSHCRPSRADDGAGPLPTAPPPFVPLRFAEPIAPFTAPDPPRQHPFSRRFAKSKMLPWLILLPGIPCLLMSSQLSFLRSRIVPHCFSRASKHQASIAHSAPTRERSRSIHRALRPHEGSEPQHPSRFSAPGHGFIQPAWSRSHLNN